MGRLRSTEPAIATSLGHRICDLLATVQGAIVRTAADHPFAIAVLSRSEPRKRRVGKRREVSALLAKARPVNKMSWSAVTFFADVLAVRPVEFVLLSQETKPCIEFRLY